MKSLIKNFNKEFLRETSSLFSIEERPLSFLIKSFYWRGSSRTVLLKMINQSDFTEEILLKQFY